MSYHLVRLVFAAALALSACRAASSSPQAPGSQEDGSDAQLQAVRAAAVPVGYSERDYDPLITSIADASRVLLGESTHGTREFYVERGRITHRLVRERGFNAIAIEGDWSPTYRVNLYVRGLGRDRSAAEALRGFNRFPLWMWPNVEFRSFLEALRDHNLTLPAAQRVGIYGMDVYDLYEAADMVVDRLHSLDRGAAERARTHYRCFAAYGRNTHTYGEYSRRQGKSCQRQAAAVLAEVRRLPTRTSPEAAEVRFATIRAAASVVAAEEYFRTVYSGANAWNVRDLRMSENVEEIASHIAQLSGSPGKVVMWSHNTHSGDARATFAASQGELNLGQLMKQRHGARAYLVGFFTHAGTVHAATEWDQPGRDFDLRPALPESYAGVFHRTGVPSFMLVLRGNRSLSRHLSTPMLERAVGVVYVRDNERHAHYFEAVLAEQFDAAIFFDRTNALRPL
jgi:erythromycin esterase-like protein